MASEKNDFFASYKSQCHFLATELHSGAAELKDWPQIEVEPRPISDFLIFVDKKGLVLCACIGVCLRVWIKSMIVAKKEVPRSAVF